MGGILRQYQWVFEIAAILLCSFFLAKIVGIYLGDAFEVQRSIGVLKKEEGAVARIAIVPVSNYQVIIDRDIFDSSEVTPTTVPGEEGVEGIEEVRAGEAVKTSLPIKVWAVLVVGSGTDKRSSATIESSSGEGGRRGKGAVDVFAVGQEPSFAPNTKLVKVSPDKILFVNSGRLEYAELEGEFGASIFGPPTEVGPAVATKEPTARPGALIKSEGAGKFTIDQSEVEKAIGNIDKLYTEIRAVPSFQGGKMSGMKILSVKRGSVFDKLGLRRGDVLQQINGMELDVRRGFEIFSQLKDAKSFTLDLVRQGKPQTFEYEIR
jgi:general secretion pathway protein C